MNPSCPESSVTIPAQNSAMQRELVDSEEGKSHIQANWRKLMYCTEVNKTVLTQLFGCNIITKEEENKLVFLNKCIFKEFNPIIVKYI